MVYTLVSISTIIFPVLILLLRPEVFRSDLRPIALITIISMVADIFNVYIAFGIENGNNLFIWHLYTFLEGILISLFFYRTMNSLFRKKIAQVLGFGFAMFSIVNIYLWESIFEYNNFQSYIEHSMIILLSLMYFYDVFTSTEIEKLEKEPKFVVSSTLLFFNSGTIFLYIASDLMNVEEHTFYYYKIHSTLHIFLNIGFAISFWQESIKQQLNRSY